jgi:hypothetical protein
MPVCQELTPATLVFCDCYRFGVRAMTSRVTCRDGDDDRRDVRHHLIERGPSHRPSLLTALPLREAGFKVHFVSITPAKWRQMGLLARNRIYWREAS